MANLLRASVPYKAYWEDSCTSDAMWRHARYDPTLLTGNIASLYGKGSFASNGCTDPSGMLFTAQPTTPNYVVDADWVGDAGGGYNSRTDLCICLLQTKTRTDWATGMDVPDAREKGDFVRVTPNNGNVPNSTWWPFGSKDLWESSNFIVRVSRMQSIFFIWSTTWSIEYQYRDQETDEDGNTTTVTKTNVIASGSLSSFDLSSVQMSVFVANDKEVALTVNGTLRGAGTIPYSPTTGNNAISWLGLGRRYPGVYRTGPGSHRLTRFRMADV